VELVGEVKPNWEDHASPEEPDVFIGAFLVKVEPCGLARQGRNFSVGNARVKCFTVGETHVGDGSYLEIHMTVVNATAVFVKEGTGGNNLVHDMFVIGSLVGGDVVFINLDLGFDGREKRVKGW
jgi:hypothetical protein